VTGAAYGMLPAALPEVDPSFEKRLVEGIGPIAQHFLASGLHHLFTSGIYDRLAGSAAGATVAELAAELDMYPDRLRGLLLYLANEDIVTVQGETVELTGRGRAFAEFRPWYTMMIGGYSSTLDQLGAALKTGADSCTRNGRWVGLGSCEISRYDGMPMTRSLLAAAGVQPRGVLDLGCGNGLYLVDFCQQMPGLTAWGAEPDPAGFAEAQALIATEGLADRVRLANTTATGFLADPPPDCEPDLITFGYVLHEIIAQDGDEAVVELLRSTVARFPRINVVVIEVADEIRNPAAMRHGLARNFWNPYYLFHYFTNQRLETRAFWEGVFDKAGLTLCDSVTTPANVDSTGLELGYLLRGPDFS
jgi:2-ketoarginine methyltransferase